MHDNPVTRIPAWLALLIGMALMFGISHIPFSKAKAAIAPASSIAAAPVVFTAKDSTADAFVWKAPEGLPATVFDDGRSITFTLPAEGTHRLYLTVRSASGGRYTEDTTFLDVSAKDGPKPPKPDNPNPPPAPGLGAWAKEEVERTMASRPTRAAEAKSVSAGIRAACAKSGTLVDLVNDLLAEMESRLSPEASESWGVFGDTLLGKLRAKYGADVESIKPALLEVAAGLEAVQ